ncbi:hypothetical protein D9M68_714100 [compost metagenome]
MNQHVVGSDANLAGVGQFAVRNAGRCVADGVTLLNDDRRLAAKLQRYGNQVFACCFHDRAPDFSAAGEDQMIERQCRKRLAHARIAHDDSHLLGREGVTDELFQQGAGCRGELRGLDHHSIAGGQCGSQRHQGQRQRVVPGGHHTDDA